HIGAAVAGKVLAPGVVGDIDLDRASLGAYAHLTVAAQRDRPDVARSHFVRLNHVHHAGAKLFKRKGDLHPVNLGGIEQTLHVLRQPEDSRPMRLAVAADTLEYARAVVDHMAHYVKRGLLPGDQIAVMPDFCSGLDGHGGLKGSFVCSKRIANRSRLSRQTCTGPGAMSSLFDT